jgi:hypothetical protein
LSELTQRRLGTHLRAMYDSMVQQPVPDRFRDLIMKLDATEATRPEALCQPAGSLERKMGRRT